MEEYSQWKTTIYLFGSEILVNSLPHNKILDWSKLKAFAYDIMKMLKMIIYVFYKVENIVGKGENAG